MASRVGLLLLRPIFILASFLGVGVGYELGLKRVRVNLQQLGLFGIIGPIRRGIMYVDGACTGFGGEKGIVVFVSERCGTSPEDYQSLASGLTLTLTVTYGVVLFLLLSVGFLLVAADTTTAHSVISIVCVVASNPNPNGNVVAILLLANNDTLLFSH